TNVIFDEYTGLSIAKSTDGGNNWSGATNGITEAGGDFPFINTFQMDPGNGQNLWTRARMLWRTTNQAGNWSQAGSNLNGTMSSVAISPQDSNFVLAGDDQGYLYRNTAALSAGAGTVWASARPQGGYVSCIGIDPTNKNRAFAVYSN